MQFSLTDASPRLGDIRDHLAQIGLDLDHLVFALAQHIALDKTPAFPIAHPFEHFGVIVDAALEGGFLQFQPFDLHLDLPHPGA